MRRNCKILWLCLTIGIVLCLTNQWYMDLPEKIGRDLAGDNLAFRFMSVQQPIVNENEYRYVDDKINKPSQQHNLLLDRFSTTRPNATKSNAMPTTIDPNSRWMAEMNATQTRRIQNLRQTCDRLNIHISDLENSHDMLEIKSHTSSLDAFVFDDHFEFMVSVIQKVGSKHWRNLFRDLRRREKNNRQWSNSVRVYPHGALLSQVRENKQVEYRLKNYRKILFTRHPLVRALSAYRDKFENDVVDHCWSVGSIILNNYRRNYSGLNVKYVHDISFSEFVEFITDPKAPVERNDRHWIPISERSNPCRIKYDILGKLETIDNDMKYVLENIGIKSLVRYSQQQETRSSRTETIKRYFSQLSPALFSKIIDLYKLDFEMFGYRIPSDREDFDNIVLF